MTAYLPPRPDLGHLRREAKSLLKAYRQGDTAACPILRHLHRFTHASDADILASEVKLNEVQFALALDYGFSSWNDLKHHVELLLSRDRAGREDPQMESKEIMRYVDAGADLYLRMIADAEHMEVVDNGTYEMMRSRTGLNNLCVVYNIRVDHLPDDEMRKAIDDIKSLGVHTWWPSASDRVQDAIHGKDRNSEPYDEELYGVLVPGQMRKQPLSPGMEIRRIRSVEEFQVWCDLNNEVEHGGNTHMHPQSHHHLIRNGKLRCYLGYADGTAVTTAAIMNNLGNALLGFTATRPEHRQRGFARAVCQVALADAFKDGIKVVAVAAIGNARMLGRSLGFRYIDPTGVWNAPQAQS